MAANLNPIFIKVAHIESVLITAANTSSQGGGTIGTDIFKAFTASATDGSFIDLIRFTPTSTVASTSTTATTGRIFLSTVATGATTSANTFDIWEFSLPVVSAANSTSAVTSLDYKFEREVPPGMTVLVTNHAAPAANTAWRVTVFGGDY